MEPQDLVDAIEALEPFDRRQFDSLLADLRHQEAGGDSRHLSRQAQYVADAIFEICRVRLPVAQLRKEFKIDTRTQELFDWFGDQIDGLSEAQQQGLVLIAIKALAYHLANRRDSVPISTKSLLVNFGDISRAMDRAYPGYWQSRLLYRLVSKAEFMAA